ncbi:MAG: hypothetical protein CMQ41_14170 [Gammaproteobacteria bacterium]|nr:hypothetical protein [Gammaproteobacteria bacterium]
MDGVPIAVGVLVGIRTRVRIGDGIVPSVMTDGHTPSTGSSAPYWTVDGTRVFPHTRSPVSRQVRQTPRRTGGRLGRTRNQPHGGLAHCLGQGGQVWNGGVVVGGGVGGGVKARGFAPVRPVGPCTGGMKPMAIVRMAMAGTNAVVGTSSRTRSEPTARSMVFAVAKARVRMGDGRVDPCIIGSKVDADPAVRSIPQGFDRRHVHQQLLGCQGVPIVPQPLDPAAGTLTPRPSP